MAREILSVPEDHLADVIKVIRKGLDSVVVDSAVRIALTRWCDDEEKYLRRRL